MMMMGHQGQPAGRLLLAVSSPTGALLEGV